MALMETGEESGLVDQSERWCKMVQAYSKATGKKQFGLAELYR